MEWQCQVCKTHGWNEDELVYIRVGPFNVRTCAVCYRGLLSNPVEYKKLEKRLKEE